MRKIVLFTALISMFAFATAFAGPSNDFEVNQFLDSGASITASGTFDSTTVISGEEALVANQATGLAATFEWRKIENCDCITDGVDDQYVVDIYNMDIDVDQNVYGDVDAVADVNGNLTVSGKKAAFVNAATGASVAVLNQD